MYSQLIIQDFEFIGFLTFMYHFYYAQNKTVIF
jgi:hypothetical protein